MLTRRQTLLLLTPFLLVIGPLLLLPMLLGVAASLTNYTLFRPAIRFVGLENYARLLGDDLFQKAALNVVVFTAISVPLALIGGLGIAMLLQKPFRGRGLVRALLLLPWLLSPVAHGVMWHQILSLQHGLLSFVAANLSLPSLPDAFGVESAFNTVILTDLWRKAPLVAFLVLPGLLAIPASLWDTGRLDGLKRIGYIQHIVWPRLRPLLLTIALLLIGDALGTSESLLYLTGGGPGTRTLMPGLYAYNQAVTSGNWQAGATTSWLLVGMVVLVGLVYSRLERQR